MLFSALAMALGLTPIIIAHVALTWFSVVRLLAPVAALLETVTEPLVIPNRRRQPPDIGLRSVATGRPAYQDKHAETPRYADLATVCLLCQGRCP